MRRIHLVSVLALILFALFCGTVSQAATRARFRAETILNDPSVRLSGECQVNEDGTVRCWGPNNRGQLGNGSVTDPSPVPVLVSGITTAVAVTTPGSHSCALLADGTVRCWGANDFAELGDGTKIERHTPVPVSGLTNAVAIAGGSQHTCALLSTGRVRCWGLNVFGQLGNGTRTNDEPIPVAVSGITNAIAITGGNFHSCALLADGSAKCWGDNDNGQLGDGTSGANRLSPVAVSGLSNAVAVASTGFHTCALLADGTARCWGDNSHAQMGAGIIGGNLSTPVAVSNLSNAIGIAAGGNHTCALLADGTARCWGDDDDGQVGDGTIGGNRFMPVAVTGLSSAVAITTGFAHTCALLANGSADCWGRNNVGQLGIGTLARSAFPATVVGSGGSFTARDVAAGRNHTCAVRANGTVSCWGSNDSGQIGDGTSGINRLSPVAVSGLSNAVAIAAGDAHTCALMAGGTVRCWGLNTSGQLGNGTFSSSSIPIPVSNLTNVVAIAAGGGIGNSHTCALLANGTVRCWGANGSGQVGDGTTSVRTSPVPVRVHGLFTDFNLFNAVSIAVGEFHSCALLADGNARCWGANGSGQLGNGTLTPQLTATLVTGLTDVVALAGGNTHTCALLVNSMARCWGGNLLGQLGNNTTTPQSLPGDVSNLVNAVAIAGGFGHTCALAANGGANCWGDNSTGQLGNGTTNPSLTPTAVKALTVVMSRTGGSEFVFSPITRAINITTGRRHSCALFANGGVSCWGDNTFGQVGIGSTLSQVTSPAGVPSFTLNIDPTVTFEHNSRVTTVTVVATCEAGQRLFFDVDLAQGTASGHGAGSGACTGGLERYEVTVPAQGRDPFLNGPAQVSAKAIIRDGGLVVDIQEWTRAVNIVNGP